MHISAIFIRRPIATSLLMTAIALFGVIAYRGLAVSDLPAVDYPTVNVQAGLPGADPATMAATVASPLERQFTTISGVDEMTSSSGAGSSQITFLPLARKAEWAPGRYALVAGFVDNGESLEGCVRREVKEEVGVEVSEIRYVGSQNWPFPSQLMCGFVAEYAGGDVVVDTTELEDARWFPCDELPIRPSRHSIAGFIIANYSRLGT